MGRAEVGPLDGDSRTAEEAEELLREAAAASPGAASDDDDDDDDEDWELPEDTVLAAVREAGFGTLLLSALVAGYAVWYQGVAHPRYRKKRLPLAAFPPTRAVHHRADQRSLKHKWVHATHTVDVAGAGMWDNDAAGAPAEAPTTAADEAAPHHEFSLWGDDDDGDGGRRGRRRTSSEALVFKHGHRVTGAEGHVRLPRRFYEAASFGLTARASSPHPLEDDLGGEGAFAGVNATHAALQAALFNASLEPPPSRILPWKATLPHHADDLDGFLVQFDLASLAAWRAAKRNASWTPSQKAEGPLSALLHGHEYHDWHEAQNAMERLARTLGQLLIVAWTPHHFAKPHPDDHYRHCHIVQDILPVRSGYQNLRESAVVWSI